MTDPRELAPQIPEHANLTWQRIVEIALLVLVFFAIAGDPPPGVNEPHYLCRLKHFWNPAWCAGDLFLESPEAHLVFVWTFGWLTKWLTLTQTAWVGRFAAWLLLAWAWQRLSWRVISVPWCACLSGALFVTLTSKAHLAGEWIVGGVEAKCFAYVFVLLALYELVADRWNRLWILLGAASAFHALVGAWSVLACGGVWLVSGRKNSLPSMLPGLFAGGLVALLGIVPALNLTWNQPPEIISEAGRIYVFERLPHHLAPLTQPSHVVFTRLTRHAAILVALFLLWRPIATSSGWHALAQREHASVIDTAALRRLGWFAWFAVLLAATGFAIELIFWNEPLLAAKLLRYYWFRLTDFAAPMAVALLAVAWTVSGIRQKRAWSVWALTALLALAGSQILLETGERIRRLVPPADSPVGQYAAWVDACEWVSEHTPPDALFITPRMAQSFKWRTGRPEVVTRKDIPQDAPHIVEWFERYQEFHGPDEASGEPAHSLAALGTKRIVELAQKYGADYILTRPWQPLELPQVYPNAQHSNDDYVIYYVGDAKP
jgi:hypothetical protein